MTSSVLYFATLISCHLADTVMYSLLVRKSGHLRAKATALWPRVKLSRGLKLSEATQLVVLVRVPK